MNGYLNIGIILLLVSCSGEEPGPADATVPLHPAQRIVALNTGDGYIINPLTGDSIQPIVNSLGDTVITGMPVPANGRTIHPDSVTQPNIIRSGEPEVISTHRNVVKIPDNLTVVPVNKTALKTHKPGDGTTNSILVNSTGDTVPTGVPIPITGKVIPCIHTLPVNTLPPHMRDNATTNMKYLDVEQGINSSYIMSILEDRRGNIWFGTAGAGLGMYNGYTTIQYAENEGANDHIIQSAMEDSQGNLWFGTYMGGVSMFDGERFFHLTEKEGLSNNNVKSIMEDSQGNLWFCTVGGGVSKYNGETITHYTENEGLSDNMVYSVLEDRNHNLWFGTHAGVSVYDGSSFTSFTENEGLSHNMVYSILEDNLGNLWFGTWGGGVNKYNGESFTIFTENEGLSNNHIWSILMDSRNNLWFGTHEGASMYDGISFTHLGKNEGISHNDVWSILEDSQGNLWFGTNGGGVNIYNRESFAHFTETEGVENNLVYSIAEDRHGNLWFGTWGGGVSRYNGKTFTRFTDKEGLSHNDVTCILEDSQGNLWLGTRGGGVSMYDGKSFIHFTDKEGLNHNEIWVITEDRQGNIWFGSFGGGVSMYDGTSFTHFTEKEGLSNNFVFSITEDSQGNLWMGTMGGGVTRYDGQSFMHVTEKEGLCNNIVVSILEDRDNNMWFGSGFGGVSMFDGDTFTHFTQKEGLSNDIVYSIIEDSERNIWLSTEKGLDRLEPGDAHTRDKHTPPLIHNYGLQDGLKGLDFYPNSALLDSKGRIWWGSGKSLTMLDLNQFNIPHEAPVIQLNRIEINEQFEDYRQMKNRTGLMFDSVAKFYNYPLNLELDHNQNHLTFHFSATDWSAPHKIMYRYNMVGLNSDWSNATSEAKADYRNLPHGTYTFKVQAIGSAQKWSNPFDYTFTINPPWYHSWWARTGYAIIALTVIFGFVRLRTARLKKRQKELEKEVENATLIIREQKEEVESTLENLKLAQSQLIQSEKMASVGILTAGIAHELNNPINFVSGNVKPLRRDVDDLFEIINKYDEVIRSNKLEDAFGDVDGLKNNVDYSFLLKEICDLLEGIEDGAGRSSQIVKGLRSFSRLDEEKPQLYDIHEGIDSSLILLQNRIKNRINIRKEFGKLSEIECFPSKLNQVILNILTNSIQAIKETGEIVIQTLTTDSWIKIVIKDDGEGMTPEVKKHIFDPFFTTKDVGKGTGLGLSISYGIIEQHGGNIDVISAPGSGTSFIISLPATQSSELQKDERE